MSAGAPSERARGGWARHLGAPPATPGDLVERLGCGSLARAFSLTARRAGESPALTIGARTVSHRELDRRAARIGGWLAAQGIEQGDRVMLAGRSSHALVAAYLGSLRRGTTALLVDPGASSAELAQMAGETSPRVAFCDREPGERLADLEPGERPEVLVGLEPGAAPVDVAEAAGSPAAPADASAPAILAYTSGTTGRPKGVPLSHANVLASIRAVMLAWRWRRDDVLVHALPLSHQHGLGGIHATLLAGTHAVVEPRFDPESLCAAVRRSEATVMMAVPSIYERLDAWDGVEAAGLDRLRLAISGSAPLPAALARRAARWLGELPLERYGSTEAGLVLSNPYAGPREPGRVGYPLPGIEVRLIDGAGNDLPPGEDGELVVRGPQVFAGYWERPDDTADAFTDGGWFRSGDIARVDQGDGSFAITGRSKEMIISGGLNVFPREVEGVLEEHPAVIRSVVVGVPSARWGEEVVAFVVVKRGRRTEGDSLIAHCRAKLSAYKCPKRVLTVDRMPADELGKVRRDELVAMVEPEGDGLSANPEEE